MHIYRNLLSLAFAAACVCANAADKLTGTPIGTQQCFDYATGRVVDFTGANLFDGDLNSYFATNERSYTWAGLDLGEPHIISRVAWAPRNDALGPGRVVLGVIQGANRADFLDAVPLYIITRPGIIGQLDSAEVDCSKGFRYVRYVGPADARCNLAELEFYGTAGDGDNSHMYQLTNLPTVSINTVDGAIPFDKETDIAGNATIIADGKIDTDASMTIRERGNASRTFPKKPWRLKFDKKQRVLGAPAKAKKWTLINSYGDKSLMRNMIAFEMARLLDMEYVPFCRAVDVVLNGEYKGCYQLCDQIEVGDGRVPVNEIAPTDIEGDALTGGYLVEVDAYAYEEPAGEWFETNRYMPVTIKSPDSGGTTEQREYIRSYLNRLESLIMSWGFANPTTGYRSVLDIESFLKHFMVGELTGNTDTYWSTYLYKRRSDPMLYVGPVWDFDLGFDNDNRTYPVNNIRGFLYCSGRASSANGMSQLVDRIVKSDSGTAADMRRIWSAARNDRGLTADNLCAYIEDTAEQLEASQQLNFMRWPIMQEYVHQNPRVPASYADEVSFIKNYITQVLNRLDPLMHYDANYCSVTVEPIAEQPFSVQGGSIVSSDDRPFAVHTPDGRLVFSGTHRTPTLPAGIYIATSAVGTARLAVN